MAEFEYVLGKISDIEALYPPAEYADKQLKLQTSCDVIRHYTLNSLQADSIAVTRLEVIEVKDNFVIQLKGGAKLNEYKAFSQRHQTLFSTEAGGKAVKGMNKMKELGVWNPMSGYHVNRDSNDGLCKWALFPPLGLNVVNQKGLLLMHYPPWQVLQQATFLDVMTMARWSTVLSASGVKKSDLSHYRTFVDVNPIAAPGSGQSEYPNDYFPIMMASAFFDGPDGTDYIRSMLELYLNPPGHNSEKYTLPLLICGSPLYDPQAPGWFRTAYKDSLPKDENGLVLVDVLQAGEFKVRPDSQRSTPYMIANHMIAAGVTGKCTSTPEKIPDIRKYEAQDLVAATFLHSYAKDPDLDPLIAKRRACEKWFGNKDGSGAPQPPHKSSQQVICALAQMDLYFCPGPPPHPKYSYKEALQRCAGADNNCNPCGAPIGVDTGVQLPEKN